MTRISRVSALVSCLVTVTALATPPSPVFPTPFDIYFTGLIAHVFDGTGVPRAVIVRDANQHHKALLILPPNLDELELRRLGVNATCDTKACVIKLDQGLGVRLVSDDFQASGDPAPIAQPSGNVFDREVPHLKRLVPSFAPESEVSDNVPSQTDVMAYFELRGTLFDVTEEHRCQGKFKNMSPPEGAFHYFASQVRLHGETAGVPVFEFYTKNKRWSQVPFKVAPPYITVWISNMPPDGDASPAHFHIYENLSTTTVTIPDVEVKQCIVITSLSPGCSNTQWP